MKETQTLNINDFAVQDTNRGVIICSSRGTIKYHNTEAQVLLQYSPGEMLGKSIDSIFHDLTNSLSSIADQACENVLLTAISKNKKPLEVSACLTPIKDSTETVTDYIIKITTPGKTNQDIEYRALLSAIVDSSDDAIVSKNLNGIISSWNQGAEKLFGYKAAEVIGKHISIIIPSDRIEEENNILNSIRQGKRVKHIDTIRIKKSGEQVHVSLTISPVINSEGEIVGASKIARDITDKIKIEEERSLLTHRLLELNKHKDEFMAMASHELKTPLTIIYANLQIWERLNTKGKSSPLIDKCLAQVRKLNLLIDDLLDVSQMQLGKLRLSKKDFHYSDVLKRSIESIKQAYEHNEIITDIRVEPHILVHGDEIRIEQALLNLLMNAIKYSPGSKTIWLTAYVQNDMVYTEVIDRGIGIAPEDQALIFDRFYRGSAVYSTFSGSGIGLYISSKVIELHGGHIGVESSLGEGSRFYYSLPVKHSREKERKSGNDDA